MSAKPGTLALLVVVALSAAFLAGCGTTTVSARPAARPAVHRSIQGEWYSPTFDGIWRFSADGWEGSYVKGGYYIPYVRYAQPDDNTVVTTSATGTVLPAGLDWTGNNIVRYTQSDGTVYMLGRVGTDGAAQVRDPKYPNDVFSGNVKDY